MTAVNYVENVIFRYPARYIVAVTILLIACAIPKDAYATYTSSCVKPADLHITPATMYINSADNPNIGVTFGEAEDVFDVIFTFTGEKCSGSGTSTWAFADQNSGYWGWRLPTDVGRLPIYQLSDGVGPFIGFGYAMAIADPNEPFIPFEKNPSDSIWSINGIVAQGALGARFKFYVTTTTNQTLPPGRRIVPAQSLGQICLSSSQTTDTKDLCVNILLSSFAINVTAGGCDVMEDTPKNIDLHRIDASQLPNKGDIGSNVDFNIHLMCTSNQTINMTLTDPNGGDVENGVLYNDTGDGMAHNVGVQLLSARDGGTTPQLLHLNESFTIGKGYEMEEYTIPMAARYYRTSDEAIVGGKVSASVVYELSYQ
ncbi:hypothetical protein WM46_07520 [Citrobacter freundii complex sp. CFNIH2]|uniref:fimbrial protein n=1 Tax=Citrobacter freundii complex sp. CFNIH2 TaxID=2066049 RepID=UPI000C86BC09|nr:fimbrial protein [Citrobacter freundii complex sp. CFNIH2]AUO64625.1 hypothetical protein WM46_07520 [Citrobacter freundii complex sp. CFNIH2]